MHTKYLLRITNDAREEEMENNMGEVNTMIGNLRNMALDMSSELDNQNQQVDRINRKVRLYENNRQSAHLSVVFYKFIFSVICVCKYFLVTNRPIPTWLPSLR
jgi:hypothetical protein